MKVMSARNQHFKEIEIFLVNVCIPGASHQVLRVLLCVLRLSAVCACACRDGRLVLFSALIIRSFPQLSDRKVIIFSLMGSRLNIREVWEGGSRANVDGIHGGI